MMRFSLTLPRHIWFVAFGIALLLAFGWVATKSGPFTPIKVTVTRVVRGEVAPTLPGIGTVKARRDYLIGPTAASRVRRVLVDVGDRVRTGQLLAEMDPVDLEKRVASAVAAVARGRSAVTAAEAQENDARSRLELAAAEARRYVELGRKGVVSQSLMESKVQTEKSAEAQLSAAEAGLAASRKDLDRLQAEVEAAQQQWGNMRLHAPVDGVVTSRDCEPGSTVVAGQSVLKLQDPKSLWVTVRLDQGRSAGLRTELPAEITLRSNRRKPLSGKVIRVEPISDSVTEERIAQVAFDSIPHGVTTGEMAEVVLHLPPIADTLTLPNAAIHHRNGQAGVWTQADGHLRFVPVKTGAEGLDGTVQVVEGLKAGDEVIVHSERELKDSSRIKVVTSLGKKAQ
jgi:HlyD family secretion protein